MRRENGKDMNLQFMRALKLMTDDEIFDELHSAVNLGDADFKILMSEAMIRLFGIVQR